MVKTRHFLFISIVPQNERNCFVLFDFLTTKRLIHIFFGLPSSPASVNYISAKLQQVEINLYLVGQLSVTDECQLVALSWIGHQTLWILNWDPHL